MNSFQALMDKFKAERDEIGERYETKSYSLCDIEPMLMQAEAQARLIDKMNKEIGIAVGYLGSHNDWKAKSLSDLFKYIDSQSGLNDLIAELAKEYGL